MFNKMGNMRISKNILFYLILCGLIVIFLFLTLGSLIMGHKSLTYDEPLHFRYGELIYQFNSDRFIDSVMPISVLNVIPAKLATVLLGEHLENEWQAMSIGRVSSILFSLGVGIICLVWAATLYGKWVGLVAFGLYVFEPNLIAHSRLITTDIFVTGMITLTLFLFWRFLEEPGVWRGLGAALALGLCQIAKYTGLFLYPLLIILAAIHYRGWIAAQFCHKPQRDLWQGIVAVLGYSLLFIVVSIMIINLGFLFNRTGMPLEGYTFQSKPLQFIQSSSAQLAKIPVPVPYPYLEGIDLVLYNEGIGEYMGRIYMLGELRKGEGFAGYYLIASVFKVPLPILALFLVSLGDLLKDLKNKVLHWKQIYLLIPALYFTIYFNFFFRSQIGIRFVLVIFPILLIFSASVIRKWDRFSRAPRIAFGILALYLIGSVASYFPHYLSYFNELVPDRKQAYRLLADSNLDWGQNRAELAEFLSEHPDYIFEPDEPTAGVIVVGANELVGVLGDPERYSWLRENFKPDGHLDYTYLIFEISQSDLLKIKEGYSEPFE
jgi:4-amino-4-deoxy-L-arabinose transferase-like glycosyltransferase